MEINIIESAAVESVSVEANDAQVKQLDALQLCLVGGGIGIVIVG
jgi:hypothetical protein